MLLVDISQPVDRDLLLIHIIPVLEPLRQGPGLLLHQVEGLGEKVDGSLVPVVLGPRSAIHPVDVLPLLFGRRKMGLEIFGHISDFDPQDSGDVAVFPQRVIEASAEPLVPEFDAQVGLFDEGPDVFDLDLWHRVHFFWHLDLFL